jgi:hypothetical protein
MDELIKLNKKKDNGILQSLLPLIMIFCYKINSIFSPLENHFLNNHEIFNI